MAATLTELRQERGGIIQRLKTYKDARELAKRSFTSEESADIQAGQKRVQELDGLIATAEQEEASLSWIDSEAGKLNEVLPRKTQPDALGGPKITNQKEAWEEDPKRGFKDHREFLTAVMQAPLSQRVDPRLKSLKSSSKEHLTAGSDEHGTYSDPYGNFFVPTAFSPETLRLDPEGNPMAGLVRSIPMNTPSISFNARVDKNHSTSVSGGLRVYRRKETQTVTASRMEHEQVELKADGIFGVAYATEELLARSLVSFIALLDAGFSDEFNAKLVNERINGSGTGEFEGALTTACKIAVTAEDGQAASSIVKGNIDEMQMRIWRYGSAVWIGNHGIRKQLKGLVHVIGTGGVQVPYYSTTNDGQAMLDGRPLFFTEFCPALGTEGDLILANWSEFLEGTLSSLNNAESMHVRFLEHERTFKFWMENAGKWWWRSSFTPKNGPTRSPVVTIATR